MYTVLVVGRFELVSSVNKIDSGVYSLHHPGVRFSFMFCYIGVPLTRTQFALANVSAAG